MHAWFPLCATMQYWMYGTPFRIEKTHYTTDCDAFHRFIHAKRSTVGMIIHVVLNKKCSLAPFRGTALPIHESIGNLLDCLTTPAHPKIIYFYKLHNFIHLGSILYRAWGNNVASLFKDGYIFFFKCSLLWFFDDEYRITYHNFILIFRNMSILYLQCHDWSILYVPCKNRYEKIYLYFIARDFFKIFTPAALCRCSWLNDHILYITDQLSTIKS